MASKRRSPNTEAGTGKRLVTLAVQTTKNKTKLLEQLERYPIVQVACERCGIGRATYYKWREDDQTFKTAADIALKAGVNFINDLAESKLLLNMQAGQNVAIIYWLMHHHPAYMEIVRHRHMHRHEIQQDKGLDPEQIALIKRAMGNSIIKREKDRVAGIGPGYFDGNKQKPSN